jgi:hypothetical protein
MLANGRSTGSSMAIFSNSLSPGHVAVEGMADVLVEFLARVAHQFS